MAKAPKKRKFFIGNSDFRTIRETNSYWVDKSLFIRDFIDANTTAALITRPRRFGKTTNLSMLRYFFDCREKNNAELFEGTKLFEEEEEYRELCGKNPVIFLTFKDLKASDWALMQDSIAVVLSELFTENIHLLDGNVLFDHEKVFFHGRNPQSNCLTATESIW